MGKKISMIIFLFLLLNACKQEEILSTNGDQSVEDNSGNYIEFLWRYQLSMDSSFRISMTPVLSDGNVTFTAKIPLSPEPSRIKCLDTAYHSLMWESNDEFLDNCVTISSSDGLGHGTYQNYLATLCSGDPKVINLTNGEVLWDYHAVDGDVHMLVWNDKFFHNTITGPNPFNNSKLVMSDIITQNFRTIYEVEMEAGYSCHLYPPAVLVNDDNDTLLYFQNRQWISPPYDGKVDFYGYNMTDDTLLWKHENVDDYGSSSVYPPLIYDDKVFFKSDYSVICYDAFTGNVLWNFNPPEGGDMMLANLVIAENKLLVKNSSNELYAVSLETGGIIWDNQDAGSSPYSLTYFDGVLYYVTDDFGELHAIEVASGKELWSITSPNRYESVSFDAHFYNGVAIDPITRRLYITDTHYINCFQLK